MDKRLVGQGCTGNGTSGFTLVEILVAILIIFIVMGGVYRTISDETINMDRQEKILDMQNNARAVLDRLTRDLRRTGFIGCGGTKSATILKNDGTDKTWVRQFTLASAAIPGGKNWSGNQSMLNAFLQEFTISGMTGDYFGESLAIYDDVAAGHPFYKEGTDVLSLVFLSNERTIDPATPMADPKDPIQLNPAGPDGYDQGDIVYIGDCENYALFQASNNPAGLVQHAKIFGLNNDDDLGKKYGETALATLFKLNVVPYFIDASNNQLSRGTKSEDLASNIEDLQVEFLIDNNDNGDLNDEAWQDGLGAKTSKDVRAVRVWVLAMSDTDFGYTDNNTYDYPNSPYYTPDPNATYKDAAGNLKPPNPFSSGNGGGGSPASQAPLAGNGEHRYRYLASSTVYLRNAGVKAE